MTPAQRRYLFGVVYAEIADHVSQEITTDQLHEYFLCKHFGWTVVQVFDARLRKPKKRSSELSTVEAHDFIEAIIQFAKEHNITISTEETT